jgi:cyanate lyase
MATKRPKRQKRGLVSDEVRKTIDESGVSRYRICRKTGISETALALFYNGQRGLSMKARSALGECLQLKIHLKRKPQKKGK